MKTWAYYNDLDPFKCEWVRELIKAGVITDGEVDCRDIKIIDPKELAGFRRVHMFCGIAVWDYALNLAGWGDGVVWTGSCPCPSFSAAGKGGGFSDPRHLWPDWFRLIRERRPANLFGEQADDAVGFGWLDLVQTDLEAADYAVGKAVFGACSVGAPHIRQRLYFGAVAKHSERRSVSFDRQEGRHWPHAGWQEAQHRLGACGEVRECPDAKCLSGSEQGREPGSEVGREAEASFTGSVGPGNGIDDRAITERHGCDSRAGDERSQASSRSEHRNNTERLRSNGHASTPRLPLRESENLSGARRREEGRAATEPSQIDGFGCDADSASSARFGKHSGASEVEEGIWEGFSGASWTNGFWRDAIWLPCRDGKYRPTQPPLQQMVDGSSESLGRVCDADKDALTEEIIEASKRHQTDPREALRDLWEALSEEAVRVWNAGRPVLLHEAPVLLAFLRQLAEQGWAFSESVPLQSQEETGRVVRSLRQSKQAARSPSGRGLDEQRRSQSSDALRVLSSILAQHAQAAWAKAYEQNARDAHPLARGEVNRVGRLRGYGDAIVAQQAQAFIEAFMNICS